MNAPPLCGAVHCTDRPCVPCWLPKGHAEPHLCALGGEVFRWIAADVPVTK